MQKTKLGKYKIIKSEPLENRYGKPIPRESIKREIEESRRLAELQDLRSTQQAALKLGKSYEEMMSDKLFAPVTRRLDSMTRRLDNLSPFETDEEGKPLTETVKDDEGKEQEVLKIKPTLKNYLNFIKNVNAHIEAIKLDSDALKNIANQVNVIHEKISKDIGEGAYKRRTQLTQMDDIRKEIEDLKPHLSSSSSSGPNPQEVQIVLESLDRLLGEIIHFLSSEPKSSQEIFYISPSRSSQSSKKKDSPSSDKKEESITNLPPEETPEEKPKEEEKEEESKSTNIDELIEEAKEIKYDEDEISKFTDKVKNANLNKQQVRKLLRELEMGVKKYKDVETLSHYGKSPLINYLINEDKMSHVDHILYKNIMPVKGEDSQKTAQLLRNDKTQNEIINEIVNRKLSNDDIRELIKRITEVSKRSILSGPNNKLKKYFMDRGIEKRYIEQKKKK